MTGRFWSIVWLCGSLLFGTVIVAVNIRDGRIRLRSRVPLYWEGESRLPVYVSETVPTPCMAGIFRPAVYLTREAAGEEKQLPYVIAHENMHYRHKDHWWAVVRTICLCVHWFNPLVWLAARLARQDGELACDADVLRHFDREERVEYGKALLELSIQRDAPLMTVRLATTMSDGKKQLRERLELIRQRPGRTAGVLTAVAVLAAVALAVTFTGRREPETPLSGDTLREKGFVEVSSKKSGLRSGTGSVFGYSDYTGYLDECVQWLDYGSFTECDYDGDGIADRVWRENIQDWGVADYRIEFGNGDVIGLPKTAGGIPEVRSLDLEGDGIREILFTETFGYSTDPKAYGQMALLRKEGEGYEMMELPGGISQVDSEERTEDGTMARYQPVLLIRYDPAGEYRLRVTCPGLEAVEGPDSLDVVVDFTQEQWEMGNYGALYSTASSGSSVPYRVDIFSAENGRDALRLYFGVLDTWCGDNVVVTMEWEDDSLRISDIRYWHAYIETAHAEIGGQLYDLTLKGSGYIGGDRYTIDSILVDHTHYDERFKGMVEDNVQLIDPGEAANRCWGAGYASEGGIMAEAVSTSRRGNILVADLNFDGNEDFCIQGWIPGDGSIPYYCYFWNESEGQFEYGGCLTNVEAEEDLKCIRCTAYEDDGTYGVRYYRYEDGVLVRERDVEESAIPETDRPAKEEVLTARGQALKGMSAEEIKRLTENIKVANLRMESAYLYDDIFGKLEDKESLYWNYFDEKGEIQVGWTYDGQEIMVYNRFDAENFMELMKEMKELVQDERLREDLQKLIDETGLAAETHEAEHAGNIYKLLHDMDYYLLRYGPEDVGQYVRDGSTIAKYYGVLSVYD